MWLSTGDEKDMHIHTYTCTLNSILLPGRNHVLGKSGTEIHITPKELNSERIQAISRCVWQGLGAGETICV